MVHLDSVEAKIKLMKAPLVILGETVHLSESTVQEEVFESRKAQRSRRRARRQKEWEHKVCAAVHRQIYLAQ